MIANANSIVQHVIQIKNGIMIHTNTSVKSIVCTCKKDYSLNPSTCICENGNYLKGIGDSSVIMYDKIINAADSM